MLSCDSCSTSGSRDVFLQVLDPALVYVESGGEDQGSDLGFGISGSFVVWPSSKPQSNSSGGKPELEPSLLPQGL